MTTEAVLLIGIFVFLVGGVFFGEKETIKVFERSGPRLGARVERQLSTARGFKPKDGAVWQYLPSDSAPATGAL